MKYQKMLLALLLLVPLSFFTVKIARGQAELPRITTVCESKLGVLTAFNDGFSIFNECPGNYRRVVVIGEAATGGDTGGSDLPGAGNIAFINGIWALTRDGKIWSYNTEINQWQNNTQSSFLPPDVPVATENIVQFDGNTFLDKDGNFWSNLNNVWTNLGHP